MAHAAVLVMGPSHSSATSCGEGTALLWWTGNTFKEGVTPIPCLAVVLVLVVLLILLTTLLLPLRHTNILL